MNKKNNQLDNLLKVQNILITKFLYQYNGIRYYNDDPENKTQLIIDFTNGKVGRYLISHNIMSWYNNGYVSRKRNGYKYAVVYDEDIKVVIGIHTIICMLKDEITLERYLDEGIVPVANHMNNVPWDNHPDNLEWTMQKYNNNHGKMVRAMSRHSWSGVKDLTYIVRNNSDTEFVALKEGISEVYINEFLNQNKLKIYDDERMDDHVVDQFLKYYNKKDRYNLKRISPKEVIISFK